MSATHAELQHLAAALVSDHGAPAVAVASLVHLARTLFRAYGRQHDAELDPLLRLQDACTSAFLKASGLSQGGVDAAIEALARAGDTACYLDGVPSDHALERAGLEAFSFATGAGQPPTMTIEARVERDIAYCAVENALLLLNGITCVQFEHGIGLVKARRSHVDTATVPESVLV